MRDEISLLLATIAVRVVCRFFVLFVLILDHVNESYYRLTLTYLLKTKFAVKIKLNLVLCQQLEEKQKQKRNRAYALCLFHNSFFEEL
jgi:hypothetical protein